MCAGAGACVCVWSWKKELGFLCHVLLPPLRQGLSRNTGLAFSQRNCKLASQHLSDPRLRTHTVGVGAVCVMPGVLHGCYDPTFGPRVVQQALLTPHMHIFNEATLLGDYFYFNEHLYFTVPYINCLL